MEAGWRCFAHKAAKSFSASASNSLRASASLPARANFHARPARRSAEKFAAMTVLSPLRTAKRSTSPVNQASIVIWPWSAILAFAGCTDLLEGSDPARAQGADISVRDVLLSAEPRIDRELADQPAIRAALLEAIGKVFLSLGSFDDSSIPAYAAIADAVHDHGAKIFAQLMHAGRQANGDATRTAAWSASPIPWASGAATPHQMGSEDLRVLVASFGVIPATVGALLQELVDLVTILAALRAVGSRRSDAASVRTPAAPQREAVS